VRTSGSPQPRESKAESCSGREQNRGWCALGIRATEERLAAHRHNGLASDEAAARLERDGGNQLLEIPPPPAWKQLGKQFTDVAVIALMIAALLAVALGWNERVGDTFLHRFGDAIAIGIIVVLNAGIGFVQERKAEHALRALRQLGAPEAKVVRDGVPRRIPARELVAGDLIELAEGDRVPADARLTETSDLIVSEAALTGESAPVDKLEAGELPAQTPLAERANMVFMGTHVARGHARALVVATGMRTELGLIAELLGNVELPDTPLQKSLRRFGTLVVIGCAAMAVVIFVIGLVRLEASLGFLLLTAVSLAVAAIPEGLPAVTTIVLALGVQRMARESALVRRLAAVETLGSADVICTDKTGTLTQNRMLVRRVQVGDGQCELERDAEGRQRVCGRTGTLHRPALSALVGACRCAPAARLPDDGGSPEGDPTDAALLRLALAFADEVDAPAASETVRTLPFDRERKMASVLVSEEGGVTAFVHGAPEGVLERVAFTLSAEGEERAFSASESAAMLDTVERWAAEGLRVIALARSRRGKVSLEQASLLDRDELLELAENELVLIGLAGIADPPRPEVVDAIARARAAGVRTLMITGDHPRTAAAISREIGVLDAGDEDAMVVTGPELDDWTQDDLDARIDRVRAVARATAANKLRLVEALRRRGHVVAMTGDGVNDAPAIKAASIGVAMGRAGTDVTREAADMVLLDDNYATIVRAIEQGRIVYGNIKRFIVFLFAVNAGLVLAVLYGAARGWPPILTPTQILWINLITNGLPALALGMEPVHPDPMRNAPRRPDERLVSGMEMGAIFGYGALMALLGVVTFYVTLNGSQSVVAARTATFTVLALSPLFHALSARSHTHSLFALGPLSNRWLLAAFALALLLQALAVYLPGVQDVFSTSSIAPLTALALLGVSSVVFWVAELLKAATRLVARKHATHGMR